MYSRENDKAFWRGQSERISLLCEKASPKELNFVCLVCGRRDWQILDIHNSIYFKNGFSSFQEKFGESLVLLENLFFRGGLHTDGDKKKDELIQTLQDIDLSDKKTWYPQCADRYGTNLSFMMDLVFAKESPCGPQRIILAASLNIPYYLKAYIEKDDSPVVYQKIEEKSLFIQQMFSEIAGKPIDERLYRHYTG